MLYTQVLKVKTKFNRRNLAPLPKSLIPPQLLLIDRWNTKPSRILRRNVRGRQDRLSHALWILSEVSAAAPLEPPAPA